MIIDFHAHPGYSQDLNTLRREFPPALRAADHHGVDRVCICSLADWTRSPRPNALRRGNDQVLALMAEHAGRVLGFCYVNPIYPKAALAEIERCIVGEGMAGIKLWIACKASDERVDVVARRAAELGVPILQHAWYNVLGGYKTESTPAEVATMAARNPDTMIVMAHLSGVAERGISDIAPYPNLLVDVAGGEPEAGVVEMAVGRFGAERVVFGTDTPIRSYGATLGKIMGARITARERSMILGGNAERLLARTLAR
jgi:hypothetical protein